MKQFFTNLRDMKLDMDYCQEQQEHSVTAPPSSQDFRKILLFSILFNNVFSRFELIPLTNITNPNKIAGKTANMNRGSI